MLIRLIHSSTFYLASLVFFFSGLLAVFLRASRIFLEIPRLLKDASSISPNISKLEITGSAFLPASALNRLAIVMMVSTLFAWGTTVWNVVDHVQQVSEFGVVNKDDSHVLWRRGAQFCMDAPDKRHPGTRAEFTMKPCPAFPSDIVAGATLRTLSFQYDENLDCHKWAVGKLGYSAWRTPDDKPVLSEFTRSTPTGDACAPPTSTGPAQEAMSARAGR